MGERTRQEDMSIELPYTLRVDLHRDTRDEIAETRQVGFTMSLTGFPAVPGRSNFVQTRYHEICDDQDVVTEEVEALEGRDAVEIIRRFFSPTSQDHCAHESDSRAKESEKRLDKVINARARQLAGRASIAGFGIGLGLMTALTDALDADQSFNHGFTGLVVASAGAFAASYYRVTARTTEYAEVENALIKQDIVARENAVATVAYMGACSMLAERQKAEEAFATESTTPEVS